jgi:hypothetical protein
MSALNGGPSLALRKMVDRKALRESGIFFTGVELTKKLVKPCIKEGRCRPVFFDPACGVGNLLIGVASKLPVRRHLIDTLSFWGEYLTGCDKFEVLVRTTKIRLAILALLRGAKHSRTHINFNSFFPMIKVDDGLSDVEQYKIADWILLNPPFYKVDAPYDCKWATGRITAAALFVEKALEASKTGTRLAAILPDVLRSGSRYKSWRTSISAQGIIERIQPYGLFDSSADVDVFLFQMTKSKKNSARKWHQHKRQIQNKNGAVGDHFIVRVGPVVPYRDKGSGPLRPFIHPRCVPSWCSYKPDEPRRSTDGPGFKPPFVVVRRTSRPGDKKRAIATIITGTEEISVENHLIVLIPHDLSLESCKELILRLRSMETDEWLNERIRCRHLTVSALNELPWWNGGENQ